MFDSILLLKPFPHIWINVFVLIAGHLELSVLKKGADVLLLSHPTQRPNQHHVCSSVSLLMSPN